METQSRLIAIILLSVTMTQLSQSIIEPVYRIVLPPTEKVSTNIDKSHDNVAPVYSTPISIATTPRKRETTMPRSVAPPAPEKTCEFKFKVAVEDSGFNCRDLELITQVAKLKRSHNRMERTLIENERRIHLLESELIKLSTSLSLRVQQAYRLPKEIQPDQSFENITKQLPKGMQLNGIRLTYGTHGNVEVMVNGEWGTVCDDNFSLLEANVICRELGFTEAKRATKRSHFGKGKGPVWFNDLHCTGNENSLFMCQRAHRVTSNCNHAEDAGVVCSGVPLRLTNGHYGRVEVHMNGQWGTVCNAGFDTEDAEVVCRQMGFMNVQRVMESSLFAVGSGPIWMTDVSCTGHESNFFDCYWSTPQDKTVCDHTNDAAIECGSNYCENC